MQALLYSLANVVGNFEKSIESVVGFYIHSEVLPIFLNGCAFFGANR